MITQPVTHAHVTEPADELDLSMIICAWSDARWHMLRDGILAAQAQEPPVREIIVVVDHNDDLLRRLQQELPAVTALANAGSRGVSSARNTGVAAASGAVVAFVDDDAAACPAWASNLMRAYRSGDDVVGVGGGIDPIWPVARPRWFPHEFDWIVGCSYRGLPRAVAPVRNVIAANMSIYRRHFVALGGFHADFGKRGNRAEPEETDLCIRAAMRWHDARWLYEPAARVRHRVTRERTTWRYFVGRCFAEGRGKASLAGRVGRRAALASERRYVLGALPAGVALGLWQGVRGDLGGPARSLMIVVGLITTIVGYVCGTARPHHAD